MEVKVEAILTGRDFGMKCEVFFFLFYYMDVVIFQMFAVLASLSYKCALP